MKYRISKDHCIPDQMQGICSQQIASQQLLWFRYWPLRCRIQQFPARKVAYWKPLKVRTFSEKTNTSYRLKKYKKSKYKYLQVQRTPEHTAKGHILSEYQCRFVTRKCRIQGAINRLEHIQSGRRSIDGRLFIRLVHEMRAKPLWSHILGSNSCGELTAKRNRSDHDISNTFNTINKKKKHNYIIIYIFVLYCEINWRTKDSLWWVTICSWLFTTYLLYYIAFLKMKLPSKILNYTTKGAHALKHFQNIKMELFGLLVIKNFKFQKYSDFFND